MKDFDRVARFGECALAGLLILLFAATDAYAQESPGIIQKTRIAGVEPSVARNRRTQILVLGTPHLDTISGFRTEMLGGLLDALEAFAPDRVCVEEIAGASVEAMRNVPESYEAVLAQFASESLSLGLAAQERLGLSYGEARSVLEDRLKGWENASRSSQTSGPNEEDSLERIELLLACFRPTSAALHLAFAREAGLDFDLLPSDVLRLLEARLTDSNESHSIGIELARRLGLAQVHGIDDHRDKDAFLRIADDLMRELDGNPEVEAVGSAPVYADLRERQARALESGDLLDLYRSMNSPEFGAADVRAQWDVFLRTELHSGLDRQRLALWEVRNLDIASHVRRVSSEVPGGRVLVVIGAGHKPFLDAYLANMLDVEVVQLADLLGALQPVELPRYPIYEDEWYLPLDDQRYRILVREYGQGDPVVVLHGGWGAEHEYVLDMIWPHLDQQRFILYDQRGSLRSPAPTESISVERHVEDLELLRAELGIETLPILAHSMGTYLAMAYLEAYPEHVGAMVLVGAIPPRLDSPAELGNADPLTSRPEVQAILEAEGLALGGLDARAQTHAWRIRFASVNLFHVDRWRDLRGGQVFYSAEAGSRAASTMPEGWDFTEALLAHDWPLTVILGDHDYVDLGAARWSEFQREHRAMSLRVLEGAGHVAWIDRPEAFADALATGLGLR